MKVSRKIRAPLSTQPSGFLFVAVLLSRIFRRIGGGKRLPPVDRDTLQVAALSTHYLLYALLFIVASLGITNAFAHGVSVFGWIKFPRLAGHDLAESLTDWHGLAANCGLAIAAFHACAGLLRHYLMRDGTLGRMLPDQPAPTLVSVSATKWDERHETFTDSHQHII